MKLLMVDNYDSFTYNIVQYFGELGAEVEVFRNDEITVAEIEARLNAGQLDRLVISPGPCSPAEAGISVAAIQHFAGKLPILGVCLGHQAIVDRVREQTLAEGGDADVMEAIYRSPMEACIAYEHREFARLREPATAGSAA